MATITFVLLTVVVGVAAACQITAKALGNSARLGEPWFIISDTPVYEPCDSLAGGSPSTNLHDQRPALIANIAPEQAIQQLVGHYFFSNPNSTR
jgi:hypothetical protein